MFLMFKNFIIYLNILLCTCAPLPNNNGVSTTIDIELKVQKELSPIKDGLRNIVHSVINKNIFNLGMEIGNIEGAVKKIIERAVNAENEKEILIKDKGGAEKEKQTQVNALLYERVRSAIEKFENDVGKNAEVEFPTFKEEKDTNIRRRIYRERKWKWIFKNRANDDHVKTLLAKIEASEVVASSDEFSKLIARAFSELSEYIHQELLRPGTANFIVKFSTTDPKVNRAIELFMDLFEIRDIIAIPKTNLINELYVKNMNRGE